ncbi:hypothetical protein [Agilicoccus flavus]|uniref:hypothetical protein n=1 Tax=Agilicoccus flavus TaxID=2775968 RepID=UPI001CF6DE8C|nr:hypothetical protein [Agilicoccus flavus]
MTDDATPDPNDRRPPGTGEPRQAVVLVHGVGNQEPMRSLRSFTHGIGLRRLFSSPDRVSGLDELRRLSEPPAAGRRAYTDFYELYWAHLAPNSDVRTSLSWTVRLLARRDWWTAPAPVARLVVAVQVLAVTAVALLVWGCLAAVLDSGPAGLLGVFERWQVWIGLLTGALHLFFGYFLRSVLSDAVRYLTPRPANIESRQRIRDEGLTLLRRLHADDRYVRVVLVGHSLGSVIAYDLLRCLWDEMRHPDPAVSGDQGHIDVFDAAADAIDPSGQPPARRAFLRPGTRSSGGSGSRPGSGPASAAPVPPPAPEPTLTVPAEVARFQTAQFALWQAARRDGVPWLVSDFVSIGSPLTFAASLLDEPDELFGGRRGLTLADQQALKEFPRCPPLRDELEDSRFYTRRYRRGGGGGGSSGGSGGSGDGSVELRVGHTAAPFGPTRWTNLYIPARSVLRGDFVAGPVAAHMGPGVADLGVRVPGRGGWASWRRHFPLAHLSYWWTPRTADPVPAGVPSAAAGGWDDPALPETTPRVEPPAGSGALPRNVDALRAALRLDDIRDAPPRPPA